MKAVIGPPEVAREEKKRPEGQTSEERLQHYTVRAWEARNRGEVGTEQMLEPEKDEI